MTQPFAQSDIVASASASDLYISAAVNRLNHVADWANAPHSTLAFAAHKSIALWSRPAQHSSTQIHRLITTPFTKPITSLKFSAPAPPPSSSSSSSTPSLPSIVAGAGDGSFAVWTPSTSTLPPQPSSTSAHAIGWTCTAFSKDAHTGSISAIGVLRPTSRIAPSHSQRYQLIVTGASDGILKVWAVGSATHSETDQIHLVQTIDLDARFPLDIALLPLPSSSPSSASSTVNLLMAVSTTTRKIDLYTADLSALPSSSSTTLSEQTSAPPLFHKRLSLEGHEDWIKSLDLCDTGVDDVIMLASGSQDGSVRLWKVARGAHDDRDTSAPTRAGPGGAPGLSDAGNKADEFEALVSKIEGDMVKADGGISTKAQHFDVAGRERGLADKWAVTFDALLVGHDSWVTGVRWHPAIYLQQHHQQQPGGGAADCVQPAALLTSSADNSLILWTPTGSTSDARREGADEPVSPFPIFDQSLVSTGGAERARGPSAHHLASSIWLPSQRFGEVGGASNLGFFGALWKPSALPSSGRAGAGAGVEDEAFEAVLAHGWGGGTHIWRLDDRSSAGSRSMLPQWRIANPVTGHFGPAKGVSWEPCGEYLLSCSVDQTTRLHARLGATLQGCAAAADAAATTAAKAKTWHEVARPQSHGYDLNAVSWLDRLSFASAADEKVVRVFSAPRGFVGSVGRQGLACAALGTEEESRHGLRPISGHRYLLALCDDAGDLAACTARHGDLMRQLADKACRAGGDEASLTAIVISDRFEDLADNGNARRYSFKRLEGYLKWMYAQAWAVAVEQQRLFFDINVLLVPPSRLGATVPRLTAVADHVSIDAVSVVTLRPSFDNARVEFATVSSDKQGSGAASDVAVDDDGKGFRTYRVVALGGTFDHLHAGHKILLSMAALVSMDRLIVGVTNDAMIAKKSNADLLETLTQRRARVDAFLRLFRLAFGALKQEVVALSDVAGPAGTDAEAEALVLTDETVSGAEFIDGMRREKGMRPLDDWVIGVLGSAGETDLKGDAKALAESKVGSTAIRQWIRAQGGRRSEALAALLKTRQYQLERLVASFDDASAVVESHLTKGDDADLSARPVGASVPPLGLSNRAIFSDIPTSPTDSTLPSGENIGPARESLSSFLTSPPTEEQLCVSTLWPELDKVYGHGYELLWLSASPRDEGGMGRYVASSCRATKTEHAVVRIHDRERNWKEVATLHGHESSVSRIRWSVRARFVVCVGKDRSWRVFEKRQMASGDVVFEPYTGSRPHGRIIWDVSFLPDPQDEGLFATGSRDRSVKIWRILPFPLESETGSGREGFELVETLHFSKPVTALCFDRGKVLVVGLEDGSLIFFSAHDAEKKQTWRQRLSVKVGQEAVNEVAFRPISTAQLQDGKEDANVREVAVAMEDGFVRILQVRGF